MRDATSDSDSPTGRSVDRSGSSPARGTYGAVAPDVIMPKDLPEPGFRDLHSYWRSRCRGTLPPLKSDIDATNLPRGLLSFCSIVERIPKSVGTRFHYRLAGAAVEHAAGRALARRDLEDVLPAANGCAEHTCRPLRLMFAKRAAVYAERAYLTWRDGVVGVRGSYEIILPLCDGLEDVRYALTVQVFRRQQHAEHSPFLLADQVQSTRMALILARTPGSRRKTGSLRATHRTLLKR